MHPKRCSTKRRWSTIKVTVIGKAMNRRGTGSKTKLSHFVIKPENKGEQRTGKYKIKAV